MDESPHALDRRWLWGLAAAALATRLVWVLWVHPPSDYVFSDMARYVARAQELAEHGFRWGTRSLAWQAFGTHYIFAVPLALFGPKALWAPALLQALFSAGSVVLAYLLGARVLPRPWMPPALGLLMLLWHPHLSNAGYFLSEPPFLFLQLWSTYELVLLLQTRRGGWRAGVSSGLAMWVRPQAVVFLVFALGLWLWERRRDPTHPIKPALRTAGVVVVMGALALARFSAHTGYCCGVAEAANMNMTAGRCHNIVTQAFKRERLRARSAALHDTRRGRRVSLPGFRVLERTWPDEHPLALRPAMADLDMHPADRKTLRFVGYIGDPAAHRELRAKCWARTGWTGQIRNAVVNVMLLYFVSPQWPESSRGHQTFYAPVDFYRRAYGWLVLVPSLWGVALALGARARRSGLTLLALQLWTSWLVAAVFFGTVRLRTPYDVYALALALVGGYGAYAALRRGLAKWRGRQRRAPV